jgi:hypothetical protein
MCYSRWRAVEFRRITAGIDLAVTMIGSQRCRRMQRRCTGQSRVTKRLMGCNSVAASCDNSVHRTVIARKLRALADVLCPPIVGGRWSETSGATALHANLTRAEASESSREIIMAQPSPPLSVLSAALKIVDKVTVSMEAVENKIRLNSQGWEDARIIGERHVLMVVVQGAALPPARAPAREVREHRPDCPAPDGLWARSFK